MYYSKLIVLIVLLTTLSTAQAWTDETPIAANETIDMNWNPSIDASTVDNPYKYSDTDITMDTLLDPTLISMHDGEINFVYTIYKQVWDATGGMYVQSDCNVTIETSVTLSYNSESGMYEMPSNWNTQISNGFMVKKYFQDLINSDSEYCTEFNTTDDSSTPDVFYTAIDVDVGDGEEYQGEMYVSIDDRDAQELANEESPYGYAMSGRGAEGGGGSIYGEIDMYDEGDTGSAEMGGAFKTFFYCFIPFIFILGVFKLMLRVQQG